MSDIFNQAALSQAVHDSLDEAYAAIPDGKSHVVLIDASRESGVRALYAQRIAGGWQIALEGAWQGGAHAAGKVTALKAW